MQRTRTERTAKGKIHPCAPMVSRYALIVCCLVVGLTPATLANAILQVEAYGGVALTQSTHLFIEQSGYRDITLEGVRFSTRPFTPPPYYGLRLTRYLGSMGPTSVRRGVELELIHDKLYLDQADDPDGIVQEFRVTDGLNYAVLNLVATKPLSPVWTASARAGLAILVSHPETMIRGQQRGQDGDLSGYYLSGLGGHLGVGVARQLSERTGIMVEYKYTGAVPRIPIANGIAVSPIHTHHFVAGLSWRWR